MPEHNLRLLGCVKINTISDNDRRKTKSEGVRGKGEARRKKESKHFQTKAEIHFHMANSEYEKSCIIWTTCTLSWLVVGAFCVGLNTICVSKISVCVCVLHSYEQWVGETDHESKQCWPLSLLDTSQTAHMHHAYTHCKYTRARTHMHTQVPSIKNSISIGDWI